MTYDTDVIRSAVKFLLSRESKVCRLCLRPTESEQVSFHDFVTIDTPYYQDKPTYLSIINTLGLPYEASLPELLCSSCATLAVHSFMFKKLCEFSQQQWLTTFESLENILAKAKPFTLKTVNAFLMIGENTMLSNKAPFDRRNKSRALASIIRNSKRRSRYIKVEERKNKKTPKDEAPMELFACPVCDKRMLYKYSLDAHVERFHTKKHIKCDECPATFSTDRLLQTHKGFMHEPIRCKVCGIEAPSRQKLYRHMVTHSTTLRSCPTCDRKFKPTSSSAYRRHVKKCGRDVKFICDICKKVYSNKITLKGHMAAKHGFGPTFSCGWCDKRFYTLSLLAEHEVTHTGVRNFACEICGNKFVSNAGLTYHRRLHTGERPYPCGMCDQHFLSSSRRMTHIRRVHLDPKQLCDICPAKFYTKHQLRRHREYHDKPHSKLYVAKRNAKSAVEKGSKVTVNRNEC